MKMMELNMRSFEKVRETVRTVLIPIGMIEAHGPHCSLGTDILIPREFVNRLEPLIGDRVLMAPEIAYGHSFGLAPFAGTIDVSAEAFQHYVLDICKGFFQNGFTHLILFNGHGGNVASLNLVSEKLADLGAHVLTINWWLDYRDTIIQYAPDTGHAGEDETSAVLAIDEKLVEMGDVGQHTINVPRGLKFKDMGRFAYPEAFSGNAAAATVEKGEQIYAALLPLIVRDLEAMWRYTTDKN
ncbi:MAG TPA: creatininase family protein [Bacilli bacterium]|nr:creatininase family protein [Bacilli bacterium]